VLARGARFIGLVHLPTDKGTIAKGPGFFLPKGGKDLAGGFSRRIGEPLLSLLLSPEGAKEGRLHHPLSPFCRPFGAPEERIWGRRIPAAEAAG
jgi:hypothetical protein